MKPTKHILLTIAMLLCSLTASAHSFKVGGIYYNITSSTDLMVEVTYQGSYYDSYSNEYSGAITIPSTITYNSITYNVTSIGESAFRGCSSLTTITIPEGVTSIGGYAFSGCSSLTSITIPEGVTSIGYNAFNGCSSLTAITLPASVTSIGDYAFFDCSSLTSITIPDGVTSIGSRTFFSCTKLKSITIPEGVTSIGVRAFYNCSSLTSITIPSSMKIIESEAFYNCTALGGILILAEIPPIITTTSFHYYLNYVYVPASSVTAYQSTEIWSEFSNIQSTELTQVDGIWYNFISKAKLAEVIAGPTSIKYSGFISIPSTVTYEGKECRVTSIGGSAFSGCSGLISITIPESVTSIGGSAFYGCSSLTSITIPEGVTSIGSYAFRGCSSLTSITLPESVTSIGEYVFYNCSSLTAITIPEGVTSIGVRAFSDCSNLIAITIPEGVTSIEANTFAGCKSLTTITFPANSQLTIIGDNAFSGCSGLTSITIPEGVTSIGSGAFYYCTRLTSITLPEGVTSIGGSAFYGCSSLTSITLPESVTSIGYSAFSGCSGLTSITLPESVTSIGKYAFSGCSSLTSIVLPEKLKSVGSKAFANCTELLDVYCYAESVPSASSDAFDGSFPEYITLHVPSNALESYKTTSPWSSFGTIVALGASITDITLSQSSATLYEGESLALTAAVTPGNADMNLISWSSSNPNVATVDNQGQVTAMAPGTTTITITANDGSGVSASCEVEVKEKLLGKCVTPVVNYVDGKVMLTCETEEATIVSVTNETTEYAVGECEETEFDLIPTYTITAYATKAKYETSDVVTITLCWVPCDENHGGEETDIITIPAKPVLIQTDGGTITVNGLAEGTVVKVNDLNGVELGTATATGGTATITTNLAAGSVAIVKIGERSVKVAIK